MRIGISDAKARLTDLVRQAERGADIVLTRHGRDAVKLVAMPSTRTLDERQAAMTRYVAEAQDKLRAIDVSAARSQDFLYDDAGLPG